MVYWPDKELSGQTDLSLEKHTLKETKLKSYAKQISQIRSRLREQAYQAAKEDFQPALELDQKYLSRLLDRIHKGYWPQDRTYDQDIKTVTPIMNRKKGSKRPMLTVGEKLTILH